MSFFLTLEGIEGCGKSTQVARLARYLREKGEEVVTTREPGGTEMTERIRELLADPASDLHPNTELLLFMADRAQHVADVIAPALAGGKTVICDRYADSTMAYQGYGRGQDLAWLETLNSFASHNVVPDLTLWLDCEVRVGLARARHRNAGEDDRFETEPLPFHECIRRGFAALHAKYPMRITRIDADLPEDEVTELCIATVETTLERLAGTFPLPPSLSTPRARPGGRGRQSRTRRNDSSGTRGPKR